MNNKVFVNDEGILMTTVVPLSGPIDISCGCSSPISIMRLENVWAMGHMESLDTECLVSEDVEEIVKEFMDGWRPCDDGAVTVGEGNEPEDEAA